MCSSRSRTFTANHSAKKDSSRRFCGLRSQVKSGRSSQGTMKCSPSLGATASVLYILGSMTNSGLMLRSERISLPSCRSEHKSLGLSVVIGAILVMAIIFAIVSYVLVSISLPQSGFRSGRVGSNIRPLASGEHRSKPLPGHLQRQAQVKGSSQLRSRT